MKEKILIIEDDPLIRNELKTLLQSNGYEAAAPEDFSDVIDRIKAEQPHLILLDIKLPGTSGFSLCTEIRTFSEVPIIFVTSCNTDMDELNSIMLGGDAFITKPYLCKRLCEKLGIGITAESSEHGTAISLSFHINCLIHEVQS